MFRELDKQSVNLLLILIHLIVKFITEGIRSRSIGNRDKCQERLGVLIIQSIATKDL